MKHLLLVFLLVSFSTALADTPAKIAEDYRKAAAAAMTRVNGTLEKATVPLIAALVKAGDTAGAEELQQQLKAKLAGEPVLKPQASAANIFKLYDAAGMKALEPAQKAAVARIEAMLNSKEGGDLAVVSELGKVRAEIEAGKMTAPEAIPVEWSYHNHLDAAAAAQIWLHPNGVYEIKDARSLKSGGWKPTKYGVEINISATTWQVTIVNGVGTMESELGTRYMKAIVK